MSKGSKQRPMTIPKSEYDARWDAIFGTKQKQLLPPDTSIADDLVKSAAKNHDFGVIDLDTNNLKV